MEEEMLLSKSCETYVLENEILISAFPGCVVFGKTDSNKKYIDNCSFKFTSFQIIELFKSLVSIISFFNGKDEQKIEQIISLSSNVVYFWKGILLTNEDNSQIKLIKFAIEANGETSFNATFSLQNINTFVYLLKRCLISSLCLKDIEEDFICSVIQNTISEIKACKANNSVAYTFVERFFQDKVLPRGTKKASFIEILKYYNSIIVQIKNLAGLYYPDE
jgi:hypothetical protein